MNNPGWRQFKAVMKTGNHTTFQSLSENLGLFDIRNKTFLIPEMNKLGCHLLAGTLRSFGIDALVLDTYKGLDFGKEFTSGKECYPCQVTTGDILFFIDQEKQRLGNGFNPADYVYFMPEATGPCRFGMYNKYQRIVLDSFPELKHLKIASLTTGNSYSLEGLIDKKLAGDLRKAAYFSAIVGDVLDRLLWRIRPYEKELGMADDFIERAMKTMAQVFEKYGADKNFRRILENLAEILRHGRSIIDPGIPPKPLIGVVGEIYLRTHTGSNQDLARMLEKHGAEVLISSLTEWIDFTTYEQVRKARRGLKLNLKRLRWKMIKAHLKDLISYQGKLLYQQARQQRVYKRIKHLIDLPKVHRVAHLERIVNKDDLFCFDVGTEACLSIAGLMEFVREGFNGVVNVYPFTCMPGTITSAIMRPLMNSMRIPYLDAVFDGTYQPGREAAVRTFMYQAKQHYQRYGKNARKIS
jgi:predicted nucleotide-binding protein (sugar kinase/HSP70/actin superfamily)